MNPVVVVPARMASTRLPGKPLAAIAGRPMLLHVLDRARAAGIGPVVAAVAEAALAEVVTEAGYQAVLTDPDLPSGSDRVHAALRIFDPDCRHDVVVNLQGDLPTIAQADLRAVLAPLADRAVDVATLAAPIVSPEEAQAESVVKVACAFTAQAPDVARALYFSRRAIPWGEGELWHHVGVYAWRRDALSVFVGLAEAALERRERLEQLRALQAGMRIDVARIAAAPHGVDTPADLARIRAGFAAMDAAR